MLLTSLFSGSCLLDLRVNGLDLTNIRNGRRNIRIKLIATNFFNGWIVVVLVEVLPDTLVSHSSFRIPLG